MHLSWTRDWNDVTGDLAKLSGAMVSSNMTTQSVFSRGRAFLSLVAILGIIPGAATGAQTGGARVALPRPGGTDGGNRGAAGSTQGAKTLPLAGTLSAEAARGLGGPPANLPTGIPARRGESVTNRRSRALGVDLYLPLAVMDAPAYGRGSSTMAIELQPSDVVREFTFYPTTQPPTWRVVPEEHPVQGWRAVDVSDVVCDQSGSCFPVTTRLLARWAPSLRAYAFRDRIGRIWRVE